MYSKIAMLEMCGWIEQAMDDIVLSLVQRHLTIPENTKRFKDRAVQDTHGFEYISHFRPLLGACPINLLPTGYEKQ